LLPTPAEDPPRLPEHEVLDEIVVEHEGDMHYGDMGPRLGRIRDLALGILASDQVKHESTLWQQFGAYHG